MRSRACSSQIAKTLSWFVAADRRFSTAPIGRRDAGQRVPFPKYSEGAIISFYSVFGLEGDMILKLLGAGALLVSVFAVDAQAHVVKFRVEHRETILNGKAFGPAGAYEKLVGKVDFALDPKLAINKNIVDLGLAPKNARGEVE